MNHATIAAGSVVARRFSGRLIAQIITYLQKSNAAKYSSTNVDKGQRRFTHREALQKGYRHGLVVSASQQMALSEGF
jgi:hypothetical protein